MLYLMWQQHIFVVLQNSLHSIIEIWIADSWTVKAWEQVSYEAKEERDVFKHELGQVHVTQSSHQHYILRDK